MFETTLLITMFSIIILLILSAFFSGTETALTGASEALMHQLEKTGNKKAKIVTDMIAPNEKGDLVWKFDNAMNIEIACNVPGHYQIGMIAKVELE